MDWSRLGAWLSSSPLWSVALTLFVVMAGASLVGVLLRRLIKGSGPAASDDKAEGQEGYIVSAVLGLLALLMGFTFSLAVDRFEARRLLVLEEANAIGTTYLRAQLLTEPHRARMSDLLVRYTDNRILLARAQPGPEQQQRLEVNDGLIIDMWAATSAAFETIKGLDFSSTYLDSVNNVIDLDSARKAARQARVPPAVFAVLFIYIAVTSAVLGYVLLGLRGRLAAGFLMALLTLSLVLIVDIDRPVGGGVTEGQLPMESLQKFLKAQPASVFDRWKGPVAETAPTPKP